MNGPALYVPNDDRRWKCPDCGCRSVERWPKEYHCWKRQCGFFAMFCENAGDRNRAQMHRLREANPGTAIEVEAGQQALTME